MTCLFCRIIEGEIPAKIIYRDEFVLAFDDIQPQAPYHKLIIPIKHIATINELTVEDSHLVGHMMQAAKQIARDNHIAEEGYRIVFNCNKAGGQTVFHLHAHLIGGRQLTWPPG